MRKLRYMPIRYGLCMLEWWHCHARVVHVESNGWLLLERSDGTQQWAGEVEYLD